MSRVDVKVPKGTRDLHPSQMRVRKKVFGIVSEIFELHGAECIETPVFELKSTLTNKYGEDSKLIYDLEDQGGELLSLRYDLTVPFARYIALNRALTMRRYQIARVYRRDQPAMNRGRFREFYQCDFDIAGEHPLMVADAEVLSVLCAQLNALSSVSTYHEQLLRPYRIKINHRELLDAIFKLCGVEEGMIRTISSSIDKLDKEPWEHVRKEMVDVKGLDSEIADKVGEYTRISGPPAEMLSRLRQDAPLTALAEGALSQLALLFEYLQALEVDQSLFVLDLSLARGLDYYTGVIFEVVLVSSTSQVGSIAAGGRYDNLVGMFSSKEVPCVGCSLGIERILDIFEEAEKNLATSKAGGVVRTTATQVLVTSIGGEPGRMRKERMALSAQLRREGIASEHAFPERPRQEKQLKYALSSGIPLVITIGEDELSKGTVQVKDLAGEKQLELPREDACVKVREMLEMLRKRDI
eukprot:CAMPEP_0184679412 /NCGR_PEP_ID=MMETSP0312-20130426/2245_1 /TAXON_ID=31354 /ORGANISM="Compsopogon coeruleus, Strain SAG 36.94" /LENGTH=468 /DNA_ID=CAMNT_0027128833 /DNA_START=147 /DNA_END=1553 /DNA_ORIENTATION=+